MTDKPVYRTIVADPPWPVTITNGAGRAGYSSGSSRTYAARPAPYPTMSVDDIAAMPVTDWAGDDAALFMWGVDAMALDGSMKRVAEAWGFPVGRLFVWRKANAGQGVVPRIGHELLMVCRRGAHRWKEGAHFHSVQDWKQVYINGAKAHSAKPDAMLDMVEQASAGPYLEIFSRRARMGWDTWGNESLHGGEATTGMEQPA